MKTSLAILIGLLFFTIALFTLPHYGINWDTINHLPRGQAYLRYLTTGKKDYSDLPLVFQDWFHKNEWFYQDPNSLAIRTNLPKDAFIERSYYQNNSLDYNYFISHDGGGHPPLSDILSAGFNRILYAKLHLVNDVDSYRVYGVLLAAILVGLVFFWTSQEYGLPGGVVASITLATYPLFWAESHFNTEKDIPEAVYWSFFMYSFWKAITTKKLRWFIVAGIVGGLALGTKFNILFSIFVFVPWLFIYFLYRSNPLSFTIKFCKHLRVWLGFLLIPILIVSVFVAFWPYLWPDPLGRIQSVISFYKEIGTSNADMSGYTTIFGINSYPLQWILFTTPPLALILSLFGILSILLKKKRSSSQFELLILLWLIVPVARVIWPHANTYGGVRQLMEFIPAFSIISGIGFSVLLKFAKNYNQKAFIALIVVVSAGFIFNLRNLYKMHPNENVYFNTFIGGLSGAKERNFPYWGFSFGAPYREAVSWINNNVEQDATLVFAYELLPNFPRLWLRPDIKLINAERSGYLASNEYAITLNYQGTDKRSYYDSYLVDYVKPVYQAKVDEVPVVTVWKNSTSNLISPIVEEEAINPIFETTEDTILISLKNPIKLWRVEIDYQDKSCEKLAWGYVQISKDNKNWERLPGMLPDDWRISKLGEQPKNGHFIEPFLGQTTRFIKFIVSPENTCLKKIKKVKVVGIS